jgi:hypothetical protein
MEEENKNTEETQAEQPETKSGEPESKVEESEAKADEPELEKPLDKMTVKELREIALGIEGLTGVHAMKKDELLQRVKEARGIQDEAPPKKKAVKKDLDVKALKGKIARLKQEKAAAREAKDKKQTDILRRRINRLKKMTRKAAPA